MISKLIFLSILSLVFVVFDLYFYKRFLSFFTQNSKAKKTITILLIFWQIGFVGLSITQFFWSIRPFFASVLGIMLFVVVLSALLELVRKFAYFERFKYILLTVFGVAFFYSFYTASLPPEVKQIRLAADTAKSLVGLRLVVLADAHIDPSKKEFADSVVRQINELDADAVLIVGDLCDGNIEALSDALTPFANLNAKYGVFFAPGNHEYYYEDFDAKMEFLRALGIKTLINQNMSIANVSIVGLCDPAASRVKAEEPNGTKAFAGAEKITILLAHQPKTAKEAMGFSPNFVFCGHTHNGQIWPFNYLVSLAQPFVYGEYLEQKSRVIVTSGVGVWGPPMRLFSRSEILVVSFF